MITNDSLLYSKMDTLPSCHQSGVIQQLLGADAQTYNQTLRGATGTQQSEEEGGLKELDG